MGAQEAGEDSCPLSGGGGCLSVRQNGISAESGGLCAVGAEFQSGRPVLLCSDLSPADSHCSGALSVCYELQERKGQLPVPYCFSGAGLDGIQLPDETQLCPGNLRRREISAGRHLFLCFCSRDAGGRSAYLFQGKEDGGNRICWGRPTFGCVHGLPSA